MKIDLRSIDRKISDIIQEIDFYSLLTPINREEEERNFFSHLVEGKEYNPIFKYKKFNFQNHFEWLKTTFKNLNKNDSLENIFRRKIEFILGQLDLLVLEDKDFTRASVGLFGKPNGDCIAKAKEVLEGSKKDNYSFPEETVTPEEMASIFKKKLREFEIDWKVIISSKIIPKITVSGKNKTLYVNSHIKYTKEEVKRLKVHEIEVHIFRGANGALQPYKIFAEGLAGYNETEEGLAIIAEELTGCLKIDTRQIKLYAGRALSVDYCLKKGFFEAFTDLKEYFPDYMAYRLVERTKRGIKDTSLSGALTKDFHYISGWLNLDRYLKEKKDLTIFFTGKIGLEDLDTVKELLNKGILEKPKYIPNFAIR